MGAPRGALEVAPGAWPVEEEPVREYCFLRLRGRSVPPLVGLEVGGAGEEPAAAAGELRSDGRPGGVGVVVWLDDGREEVGGERGVEPRNNAGVHLCPFGVGDHGVRVHRAVDVILDAELAEEDVEEGAPDGEVRVADTESDRDMRLDVDELCCRCRDGHGRCGKRVAAVVRGPTARRHGGEEKQQRRSGSGGGSDGEWYHE